MRWQEVKNKINTFLSSHAVSTWMINSFRFRPLDFIDKERAKDLAIQSSCSLGSLWVEVTVNWMNDT